MRPLRKLLIVFVALVVFPTIVATWVYRSIPSANTNLTHFDTIIVLGTPINRNSNSFVRLSPADTATRPR